MAVLDYLLNHPDHATVYGVAAILGGPFVYLLGNALFKWATNPRPLPPFSHMAGMALLLSPKPYRAYALCAQAFYPLPASSGLISPAAHVDPTAVLGADVEVAAGVVIEAGAEIGPRTRIAANAVIGRNVRIGADSIIGACASLSHCLVGDRVVIYPGARIG